MNLQGTLSGDGHSVIRRKRPDSTQHIFLLTRPSPQLVCIQGVENILYICICVHGRDVCSPLGKKERVKVLTGLVCRDK